MSRVFARHPVVLASISAALACTAAAPAEAVAPPVNGRVVFESGGALFAGDIALAPGSTTPDVPPLNTGVSPAREPAWSPSATKIAFSSRRTAHADLWSVDVAGSRPQQLTTDPAADTAPAWSPDGGSIAFTSRRAGTSDVWVMGADGTAQQPLVAGPAVERQAAWSPLGVQRRIAFASNRSGVFAIWLVDVDGSNARLLSSVAAYEAGPTWSPDGRYIAFAAGQRGATRIVAVDSATGELAANVSNGPNDRDPAWSPDGRRIVYSDATNKLVVADVPQLAPGGAATSAAPAGPTLQAFGVDPDWAPAAPPAPDAVIGEAAVTPSDAAVKVQVPSANALSTLGRASQLPTGTVIDTSRGGSVEIAAPVNPQTTEATTAAVASGGRFTYTQDVQSGTVDNVLTVRGATGCASTRAARRRRRPTRGRVRVRVKKRGRRRGHWSAKGPHVVTSAHATEWVTTTRCGRDVVRVISGDVHVTDRDTGESLDLRKGQCYVAPGPVPAAPRRHCD